MNGIKYKRVAAFTTDTEGGFVPPSGEMVAVAKVRLTGGDPDIYSLLAYDFGGPDEKIFASTRGDINFDYETSIDSYQVIGDGIKKISIVIVNDSGSQSPIVGGSFETLNFGVPAE